MTDPAAVDIQRDLDMYGQRARAWLAENMSPKTADGESVRGAAHSKEHFDRQRELQRQLFDAGWAGIVVPTEYGGQGLSPAHADVFAAEASPYQMPDFGILTLVTYGIVVPTILAACSDSFKRRHVPRILAGAELWCQLLSEPGAGSDLAGIVTRATRDGDSWVINGSKVWSSGAMFADYGLCITRTDWDAPKHKGLTWFAAPLKAPGATVRPIREINGGWEFCEAFLDDLVVDADEVMGEVDDGWQFTHTMLVYERGAMRGPRVRVPTSPAPDLVALARSNGTLADSHTRQRIATGHVYDVVRAALGIRIEREMARTSGGGQLASYVKLARGVYDPLRARIAMDIAGHDAIAWVPGSAASMTGTTFLNGRVQSIAGGTNEMQRNGISERILGLPREPTAERDKPFREVLTNSRSRRGPAR